MKFTYKEKKKSGNHKFDRRKCDRQLNKLLVNIPISNLLHCFLVDFHNSIYISLHQVDFSQLYEGGVMTVVLNRMFQTVFGLDTDAEISI